MALFSFFIVSFFLYPVIFMKQAQYIFTVNVYQWKKPGLYRVLRLELPGSVSGAGRGGM